MRKNSFFALLAVMVCGSSVAGIPNPFDPLRSAKTGKDAMKSNQDSQANLPAQQDGISPPPTKVLCGISQSMDSLSLCVDGRWMSIESFEQKFKRKVIRVSKFSMKISGRSNAWALGEPLGGGQKASVEAQKGEKHD